MAEQPLIRRRVLVLLSRLWAVACLLVGGVYCLIDVISLFVRLDLAQRPPMGVGLILVSLGFLALVNE